MEQIVWTEEFSVGVEKLDEQHKILIGMINKLIRDPQAATRSETVSDVLGEMTNYALEHFAFEENLMAEHGYPQSKGHVKEHRAFQETTSKFCTATAVDVLGVPEMLLEHLSEWLVHHILEIDMAYRPFFQERSVQ
ncbi:MAG: bacteriohemerythrin [Phycisphaerae bacterium]|jgi:hemerythrin-like metal-binding protein|nr:bacteriohemerythrin [Phycisphaerae bacterium]